nr:retrovirus-related Pol polyprotein from transposon TNT 1-94 [Tanacetum cinerariifolium]
MSRMQLNSKFVNNMLPEWGRFVTAVKLNRGLRDSNYDQLYAYLKQHEAHTNENKMMLDRFTQHTVDPLALMSNVSHPHHYLPSSSTPPSTYVPPYLADNAHLDSSLSPTDNLIKNLTNTLALLTQSYKTFLPQTNNQLRTSSNTRNQATLQDGRVVVQNVQDRQNRGQGTNPQGGGAAGYGGVQNRVGNANPGQARQVKQDVADASQENGVALDEEQLLFLTGGQDNTIDEDVDEQPVQDLALNVDNVFQVDDYDAFDYDVDEAPTAQAMFMENLSSADPVYDEAGPSYDSNILSEVHDHGHYQDAVCEHHEEHAMHDNVQLNHVVNSHADYTSDSNMIPYELRFAQDLHCVLSSWHCVLYQFKIAFCQALRKCILSGPYKPTTVLVQAVDATDDSPAVPEHTTVEIPMNMSLENKAHFLAEKEAVHLILTELEMTFTRLLARNANPLALVATAQADQDQYYQTSRSHRSSAPLPKPSIPSRSHTTTKHKGKEIAKPITPLSETASEEDSDPEQAQRDNGMQKNLTLIAKYFKKIYKPTNNNLRTSSNSKNKNVDTTPRFKNDNQSGQFRNQKTVNVAAARENVGISNTCLVETNDSNVIPDLPDMCEDDIQNDQNDVESEDERVAIVNLIANLKLDVDENKKIQKQLKKANTPLAQELKECKAILTETSKSLGESISVRDSCLVVLQTKQAEFEKYKAFNDREKHNELMKQSLLTKSHYEGLVKKKTKVITDLKLREEHDIEKMLLMEKQLKFLNEIVYKRSQSIQTIHMMAPKVPTYNGRPTFSNPRYLKQAQSKILYLYAFLYDQNTHANRLIPDREETLAIERESRSKLNKDLVHPYEYTTLNSLYEIFKPPTQEYETQLAHENEIRRKMWQKSFVKSKLNIYKNVGFLPVSKSISKSPQAYNVMTNNVNHFKEIFDNAWIKHSKDLFRAPTAQDMEILIQTCLMPLAIKTQNDKIDELESDKAEFSDMYDVILQECVSNDVKCSYLQSLSDLDALDELQCMYLHKVKECDCLAQKLSKQTESVSKKIVQLILFIFDSGCTKHMTGNLKLLCNFVEKFMGTVRFGNDQFAPILGYEDLVQGNVTINMVYYVEGLNHNLFSVGQFCDADLEVAFRKSTCFVRDLQGNDLLVGNHGSDLYTISLHESTSSTPLYLMAKAIPTQAWLWHRRLSHLNFDYINLLSKKDIVIGLPKLKDGENLDKIKEKEDRCILASDYDNPDPVPQRKDVYSLVDADVPSQQELDLLFGPLYDEFFNAGSNPSTNVQSTQAPSTHTNMHAEENHNDQSEEGEHVQDDEFTNPFCAPAHEQAESSSHNI